MQLKDQTQIKEALTTACDRLRQIEYQQKLKSATPYERRRFNREMELMQQNLQRVRTAKLPRRTFSFSSRKLAGKATTHAAGVDQSEYQDNERLTDGLTGETVKVPYNGGDYLLQNLTQCEIIVGNLDALYVDHLQGCTLVAENITGGFHVENCYGCTFKVTCHQLRIH